MPVRLTEDDVASVPFSPYIGGVVTVHVSPSKEEGMTPVPVTPSRGGTDFVSVSSSKKWMASVALRLSECVASVSGSPNKKGGVAYFSGSAHKEGDLAFLKLTFLLFHHDCAWKYLQILEY